MPLSIPSFYSRIRVWRKCWPDQIVTSIAWRWFVWSMGSGALAERRRPGWSQTLPPPLLVRLPSTLSLRLPLLLHLCLYLRRRPLVCRRVLLCLLVITWWSEAITWWPLLSLWVSSLTTCTTTTIRLFNISTLVVISVVLVERCFLTCFYHRADIFKSVWV